MKSKSILVLVLSVCLCVLPAFGTIHFNDGGTHYIDYESNDGVWVDYQAPGMETTVNLITGGIIRHQVGDEYYLHGYTDSHINISGGIVEGHLYAHDNSQVDISSGWLRRILHACNGSQVTVSGGHIGDHIYLWDYSHVNFSNGSVFNSIGTHANSELTVSGGTIGADLYAGDNSKINFSGGLVARDLTVMDHSHVDFSRVPVAFSKNP